MVEGLVHTSKDKNLIRLYTNYHLAHPSPAPKAPTMSYQGLGAGRVEHRRPHGQLSAEKEASVWFAWHSCHRSRGRSRRFWVAWCPLGWALGMLASFERAPERCKAGGCGGMESRLDILCGYGLNGCTNGPLSRDRLPTNGSGFKSHRGHVCRYPAHAEIKRLWTAAKEIFTEASMPLVKLVVGHWWNLRFHATCTWSGTWKWSHPCFSGLYLHTLKESWRATQFDDFITSDRRDAEACRQAEYNSEAVKIPREVPLDLHTSLH